MSIITVEDLVKKYQKSEKPAVDGISFDVKEGEFFTFLGPNGAGKTTTISILTTTLNKSAGKVTIAGYDLDTQPEQIRQNLGVIFQLASLDLNLSAEENIRFHSVLYGLFPFRPAFRLMPKEYRERVDELAAVLGIQDSMFQPVKTFSGGMRRKLEIVRSLMHRPKVLFLDEPTSGLDPQSRRGLWDYLMEVRKQDNTTIFLTTHYLEEAEDADRVCVIDEGMIVMLGTPKHIKEQLISNYIVVETEDVASLEKELQKMGLQYDLTPEIRIHLNSHNPHQVLKDIDTPLSSLNVHIPTLEEAYLEIIANDKKGEPEHAPA